MKVLAVIPARGGSKAIPDKNLADLAGRPLIDWTIQAAKSSRLIDRVIVSTDSEAIADAAKRSGASVPFKRPAELSDDSSSGTLAVIHAVRWLGDTEGYDPDVVICLQPTSPFRTSRDIDQALSLLREKNADAVVSVTAAESHPYWMKKVLADGRLSRWLDVDGSSIVRQELPAVWTLNGAIYAAKRTVLLERGTWYTDSCYAYVMPAERSLDIDTPWHLHVANLILRDSRRDHDIN